MSGLVARISLESLRTNAQHAAAATPDGVADLRRDAYGHGVAAVSAALRDAGITKARVDEQDAALLADGVTAVDDDPTVDSAVVYGFATPENDPAMSLVGRVLSVKPLLTGEGVSYNHTHIATRDTRIALVTGGFGQGVVRAAGNAATVQIRGALYPIIGRVAMDVCVVDIGEASIGDGDEVVFFGGHGPAWDALGQWHRATGLTPAEIVCALGVRVQREIVT